MILTAKEPQSRFDELGLMNSSIVNQLISEIPQLSSIYFVPGDQMTQASSVLDITTLQSFNATQRMNTKLGNKIENILDLDFTYDMKYDTNSKAIVPPNIDLLGDDIS